MGLHFDATKTRRNQKICDLYVNSGMTMEELGEKFGLTRQRVQQIIIEAGGDGSLRERDTSRNKIFMGVVIDPDVLTRMKKIARRKKMSLSSVVNEFLNTVKVP